MKARLKIDKEYIKTQLEALPYIFAAVLFSGVLWFVASMLVLICERS